MQTTVCTYFPKFNVICKQKLNGDVVLNGEQCSMLQISRIEFLVGIFKLDIATFNAFVRKTCMFAL